jgi:hypothetical protein
MYISLVFILLFEIQVAGQILQNMPAPLISLLRPALKVYKVEGIFAKSVFIR